MEISLCTYTYNDGYLLDRLLQSVQRWQVKPAEIIVIDDGSSSPYTPPADVPVKLTRHSNNKGFRYTKQRAIDLASCEAVVSLDCDMRLCDDWLGILAPFLERPEIGLLGGAIHPAPGNNIANKYLKIYDVYPTVTGERDFIPGNAWLISKQVWQEVGGFSGHQDRVGEDVFLCQRIRSHGYKLFTNAQAIARQTRRLSRIALVMRLWRWQQSRLASMLSKNVSPVSPFLQTMAKRVRVAQENNCCEFCYIELLYFAHAMLDARQMARQLGKTHIADSCFSAVSLLLASISDYPVLLKAVLQDLDACNTSATEMKDVALHNTMTDMIIPATCLQQLNNGLVVEIIERDRDLDFSSYAIGA